MKQLSIEKCPVEIGPLTDSSLQQLLDEKYKLARKVIFVDENTHDHCLDFLLTAFPSLEDAEVMLLPAGEENKVLEICVQVWAAMSEYNIGRQDLVLNVGGGVVTDMGGFIASVYKRGIPFVNIPTSLLGMVDAALGGKTGIDLHSYKNQLGTFTNPDAVFIDSGFLNSLPEKELVSGFAEMIKHALITSRDHWEIISHLDPVRLLESHHFEELIAVSVVMKSTIVNQDVKETGVRKVLNFGHTIGHAIEGFFLESNPISHGHAVALGIMAESYISFKRGLLTDRELLEITTCLSQLYDHLPMNDADKTAMIVLMHNDKKNSEGKIKCVLLEGIGQASYDNEISEEEAREALNFVDSVYYSN